MLAGGKRATSASSSPPAGVISVRKSYYEDFGDIETPDDTTVIFKMKPPVAGVLELLASPFNCIYSAAKLKSSPNYPAREIMGSGAFELVEHVQGSHWIGQALRGLFQGGPALPRRLQGLLREVARRRARPARRPVRCRIPLPHAAGARLSGARSSAARSRSTNSRCSPATSSSSTPGRSPSTISACARPSRSPSTVGPAARKSARSPRCDIQGA